MNPTSNPTSGGGTFFSEKKASKNGLKTLNFLASLFQKSHLLQAATEMKSKVVSPLTKVKNSATRKWGPTRLANSKSQELSLALKPLTNRRIKQF